MLHASLFCPDSSYFQSSSRSPTDKMFITPMSLPLSQKPSNVSKEPKYNKTPVQKPVSQHRPFPHIRKKTSAAGVKLSRGSPKRPSRYNVESPSLSSFTEHPSKECLPIIPEQQAPEAAPASGHKRSVSEPTRICRMQRWDGIKRSSTDWNSLHKVSGESGNKNSGTLTDTNQDSELWHEDGNCMIFLYRPGQSQRGASYRFPRTLLEAASCGPLLDQSMISTNYGSPWKRATEDSDDSQEYYLYLYAPPELGKDDAFQYHVTTRNFVAWMLEKPLVGVDPTTAILDLKDRMEIWRDHGADNLKALHGFIRRQGYSDSQEMGEEPSYLERLMQQDAVLPKSQSLGKRHSMSVFNTERTESFSSYKFDKLSLSTDDNATSPIVPFSRSLSQSVRTRPPTPHASMNFANRRAQAPVLPPAAPKISTYTPHLPPPCDSSGPTTPDLADLPDLSLRSSNPCDSPRSESGRSRDSSVRSPSIDEVKAFEFDFGFGKEDQAPERDVSVYSEDPIDELINALEEDNGKAVPGVAKTTGMEGWI